MSLGHFFLAINVEAICDLEAGKGRLPYPTALVPGLFGSSPAVTCRFLGKGGQDPSLLPGLQEEVRRLPTTLTQLCERSQWPGTHLDGRRGWERVPQEAYGCRTGEIRSLDSVTSKISRHCPSHRLYNTIIYIYIYIYIIGTYYIVK